MLRLLPLLLLATAACARGAASDSAPNVSADPLAETPWRPAAELQTCRTVASSFGSVDQLADSVSIARFVSDSIASRGHALWTIAFDSAGRPAHMRALELTLDTASVAALQARIYPILRTETPDGRTRLRIDVAETAATSRVRMQVGATQYCPPLLQDADAVRRAMGTLGRSGRVVVDLVVAPDGSVTQHRVAESSGNETTDRMATGLVAGLRYEPAVFERRRVPARILYEVVFR